MSGFGETSSSITGGPNRSSKQLRSRGATTVQFIWSYLPDWILALLFAVLSSQLSTIPGFKREFSLNDISIQHTYAANERVPRWALHLISGVAPVILMPIVNLVFVRSLWDLHNSLLGLALSLSLTGSITNLVKVTAGRPRPDLISRCLPQAGSADHPGWGLSNNSICTQTNERILRDGFRSFPSGHSSLSFAGLGFLSFYLAGKLHLWDERGYTGKAWLSLTPLIGAALIAISRTMDYRHHWEDVVVGSLLGLVLSYFSYRQFFPSLSNPASQVTHAPRIGLPHVFNSQDRAEGTEEEREALFPDEGARREARHNVFKFYMLMEASSLIPRDTKVPPTGKDDSKQSKALVRSGATGSHPHGSTSRALVLREAAWGKGEIATTRKISGQDKLRLLAGEMMNTAVRAPFRMEELLKMAQSQLGVHLDEISNLKDPAFFCDDILATIDSRIESVADQHGKRNPPLHDPAWVASVVGTRIHNVYTLAGSWRIVRNTLKDLEAMGLDDTDVQGQLRVNEKLRAQYFMLYDTVTTLARLGQQRLANSAAATPHYAPYFIRKDKGASGEPEMEFDQRGNNRRKLREAHRSYIDSIILELVLPDSQYPPYVLMSCLRTAVEECRKEEKRFTQAFWDAVGDLSITVQVLDLLELPLLGSEGVAWTQDKIHLSKQFTQFLTAQASSAQACSMINSWKAFLRPPLTDTKKPHVLAEIWNAINMSYRKVCGVGIDTLWSLQNDLDLEPQWSTRYAPGLTDDQDSEPDSHALTLHKTARRVKDRLTGRIAKQITGGDEVGSDYDNMPGLMSVSDSSAEDDEDSDSDTDSDTEGDYESDYDPEEDEWLQDMLQDALNATIDMDDLPEPAFNADDEARSENPFKRMFSRLKDRVFSANPTLRATEQSRRPFDIRPGTIPPSPARPVQVSKAQDSKPPRIDLLREEADDFATRPKPKPPQRRAADKRIPLQLESEEELPPLVPPNGFASQGSHKTTLEEVEDKDDLEQANKKKKKKKKKKSKTTQAATPVSSSCKPSTPTKPSFSNGTNQSSATQSFVSNVDTLEENFSRTLLPLTPETAQSARSYLQAENLVAEKNKVKTRPAFVRSISKVDKNNKNRKSDEENEKKSFFGKIKTLHLPKRAVDLFGRLFSPADGKTHAKKPMKWEDFLKFMRLMGFSYDPSTAGSSVRFDPPDPKDPSISFHKPHPDSTLQRGHLQKIKKRLEKTYGWSSDRFEGILEDD